MSEKENKMSLEFQEFLSAHEIAPPVQVTSSVLSRIQSDLNPSQKTVFLKVLGIHSVVSLFTLSICSQFGIQTVRIYDAMETMMASVGHTYCMAFCGLLYLGVSAFALSLLMRPEEIKVIRKNRLLQFTLLSGVSMGVFLCLGAQVLILPGVLWVTGSLVGSMTTFELGWLIRENFRRKLIFGN